MASFKVKRVIDGDTFEIEEGYVLSNGKRYHRIRPTGYDTPEKGEEGYEKAKQKLESLILNEMVEIRNEQMVDDYGRLVIDVYYNGKYLAEYFSEYKS